VLLVLGVVLFMASTWRVRHSSGVALADGVRLCVLHQGACTVVELPARCCLCRLLKLLHGPAKWVLRISLLLLLLHGSGPGLNTPLRSQHGSWSHCNNDHIPTEGALLFVEEREMRNHGQGGDQLLAPCGKSKSSDAESLLMASIWCIH